MYPNPQDALPFPSRPNLDQYRKLAKDLVKACKSGDASAVRAWTVDWLNALATRLHDSDRFRNPAEIDRRASDVEQFARTTLSGRHDRPNCALADAQFVIARAHGFVSWPVFAAHLESLARSSSPVSAFEAAVRSIITGDRSTLERLLREDPGLVRARSTREHRATLLHYVSANGVEGYRQVSPNNIAEITRMLLDAGAEVDAGANVYGSSRCTALGLVATSAPPDAAGVQLEVIDVLLDHGARTDLRGLAGRNHPLIHACLANGQPEAAAHLARRGAPLDFAGVAGLGRVDVMRESFDAELRPGQTVTPATMAEAFWMASGYGHAAAAQVLLDHGVDVDMELKGHGDGHTALHAAAYYGHPDVVSLLLQHGARVDVIDKTWKTPPLVWALTGWSSAPAAKAERYYTVAAVLVRAGAQVRSDLLEWDKVRKDPQMIAALGGKVS
jgi:Ankyrin repeats (3 copies)